jgi:hypothetical protein
LNSELVWIFAPFPALLQGRCEGCDFKAANATMLIQRAAHGIAGNRDSAHLDNGCAGFDNGAPPGNGVSLLPACGQKDSRAPKSFAERDL